MGKEKDRANKPELSVMVFPQRAREGRQEEASYSVHHPHETNAAGEPERCSSGGNIAKSIASPSVREDGGIPLGETSWL